MSVEKNMTVREYEYLQKYNKNKKKEWYVIFKKCRKNNRENVEMCIDKVVTKVRELHFF